MAATVPNIAFRHPTGLCFGDPQDEARLHDLLGELTEQKICHNKRMLNRINKGKKAMA